MTTPNTALRAVRMSLRLSQDDLAREMRRAGAPNATKRQIQRYESGQITSPRPVYARALEVVCRMPIESLGFEGVSVRGDGLGGHDVERAEPSAGATPAAQSVGRGNYSGIWLSRYEYYSSGRGATYAGLHYVLVLQHSDRLTVRSLPGSAASSLSLDLTVDGAVITGTWVEQTDPEGYYRAARYHGAIQMLAEPTGRRMRGKWLGFGKDMDVNSGPWELVFQDASTTPATIERYNRRPETD